MAFQPDLALPLTTRVIDTLLIGSMTGCAAVGVWGIVTVREIEKKVDRVVLRLFGDPDIKDAEGLITDLSQSKQDRVRLWGAVAHQSDRLDHAERRIDKVETTCSQLHPRRPGDAR
jgi:hypothetical protein